MTREALVPIREEEQRRACQALGISDVVFLGYEDGVLEPSIALRRDLTRIIRRYSLTPWSAGTRRCASTARAT